MILVREIPGHWSTDQTSEDWLTDAAIDGSLLPAGARPLAMTCRVVVQDGDSAGIWVRCGGAPGGIAGSSVVLFASQAGPFDGTVTLSGGTYAPVVGELLLHLSANATTGSVEISDATVTIQ